MVFDLDCKPGFRPKLILSLTGFGLFSLLLSCYTIGSSYLSVSGYGDWGIPGQELVVWLSLLAMVIMGLSLIGLFFNKTRCVAMALFLGTGMMVVLCVLALKFSDRIRLQGFERLAYEAAPLVEAIQAYEEEYGVPPENLEILKVTYPPDHIIKGGNLPDFKYVTGYSVMERYHGNPWVLMLETPTGPLRWDRFIYYPLQNYPSIGHGGWIETIGAWGYVHE